MANEPAPPNNTPAPPPAGDPPAPDAKAPATVLGTKPEGDPPKPDDKTPVLGPDGKPIETKPDDKKPDPAPAIDPAKITLPEGFKADEPVLKAAVDLLVDPALSPQDRAQKLIDLHAQELKKATDANAKYWSDLQTEWQAKAKETYGPEPAKSPKIIAVSKLIDSLGEKPAGELRDALEMSGMGNHPAIIGAFVTLAERLTEAGGTIAATKPTAAKPQSLGEAFYGPNQNSGA